MRKEDFRPLSFWSFNGEMEDEERGGAEMETKMTQRFRLKMREMGGLGGQILRAMACCGAVGAAAWRGRMQRIPKGMKAAKSWMRDH